MSDPRCRKDSNTPIHTLLEHQAARIETLETRIAYQEDWLEKLDTRLLEQQRYIEQLQRSQQQLLAKMQEEQDLHRGDHTWLMTDEPPPHY